MTDADDHALLGPHLARWRLEPDGAAIGTTSSALLPVRRDGVPLMLKVPRVEEERRGGRLMAAWDGRGAARVHESDGDGVVLLARAEDPGRLARKAAASGPEAEARDEAATRILARAARRLHETALDPRAAVDPVPLVDWFRELLEPRRPLPRALDRGAGVARELLAASRETAVLHGDLHHGNVLWFADESAWLAIDPKALVGDPGFDTANVLCNPTLDDALRPGRLDRRAHVIAEETGQDLDDVLAWAEAWCALSAAWDVHDPAARPRGEALLRLAGAAREARGAGRGPGRRSPRA